MANYEDTGLWKVVKDIFNANSEISDWNRFIRSTEQYYNEKKGILLEIDNIKEIKKEIVERERELERIHLYIDKMINNSKSADNLVGSRLLDRINYMRDTAISEINYLRSSILEKKHLKYAKHQSFWSIISMIIAVISLILSIFI